MDPYRKEKIENAVCFFAEEHKKITRGPLYQTFLYKYLAFLDFESVKKTGRPALGLNYLAMERGPVPTEIYNQRKDFTTDLFEFKQEEENKYYVVCKKKPNLDYFSSDEINLMRRFVEIFADRFVNARLMSDASHEEIPAWKKTWALRPNNLIDYALVFDDNLFAKSDEELSYPEESHLIHRAIER